MKDLRLKSKVYLPINSLFAINGQLKIHVYEKVGKQFKTNLKFFAFSIFEVLAYEQILT